MRAPSEMELITMLFTVEGGRGWSQSPQRFLVGWFSCPNSSISTKPLLENGVPSSSNDTTEQMIMGREGKKYQTYKVSITWTIGHILCYFSLMRFSSFMISFHNLSFKKAHPDLVTWSDQPWRDPEQKKSRPGVTVCLFNWTQSSYCRLWRDWFCPAPSVPPCSWCDCPPWGSLARCFLRGSRPWRRPAFLGGRAATHTGRRWSRPRRCGRTPQRGPPTAWARWAAAGRVAGWSGRCAGPPAPPVGPSCGWCGCSGILNPCRVCLGTSGAYIALHRQKGGGGGRV